MGEGRGQRVVPGPRRRRGGASAEPRAQPALPGGEAAAPAVRAGLGELGKPRCARPAPNRPPPPSGRPRAAWSARCGATPCRPGAATVAAPVRAEQPPAPILVAFRPPDPRPGGSRADAASRSARSAGSSGRAAPGSAPRNPRRIAADGKSFHAVGPCPTIPAHGTTTEPRRTKGSNAPRGWRPVAPPPPASTFPPPSANPTSAKSKTVLRP